MFKENKSNIFSLIVVFGIFLLVIGCQPDKGFKSINYGCLTKDGTKIALSDFHKDFALQTSNNSLDNYRLILDAKDGKFIWKDFSSSDQLVCGPDSSIVSVSQSGAKWVESQKELVFSKKTEGNDTNFIGMTDPVTLVREIRSYSNKEMRSGSRTTKSSIKDFNSYPTFWVDKVGENTTKEYKLKDEAVAGLKKTEPFRYLFRENQIIFADSEKAFALSPTDGKVSSLGTGKEFLQERAKTDQFSELNKTVNTKEGTIEIYDLKSGEPKLTYTFDKSILNGNIEHIIDCCQYGLFLLYWGKGGNSLEVAKIDPQNGKIIWTSENLLSYSDK